MHRKTLTRLVRIVLAMALLATACTVNNTVEMSSRTSVDTVGSLDVPPLAAPQPVAEAPLDDLSAASPQSPPDEERQTQADTVAESAQPDGNPLLDVVRGLASTPLPADVLAGHEDECRQSGRPLRWVGNGVEVTDLVVTGEPWASALVAEVGDDAGLDPEHWSLCLVLRSAPEELFPCPDDRESGGRGPILLEGVEVIAVLSDTNGDRIATSVSTEFGLCPYARDEDLPALLERIADADGRLPSDLGQWQIEGVARELLDFGIGVDRLEPFDDLQCQALATTLIAHADFVLAANETFGMDRFARWGPNLRVPSYAETEALHDKLIVAGRTGERALRLFFAPRSLALRPFTLRDEATIAVATIYNGTFHRTYTPHEAAAHFVEDWVQPGDANPSEWLRRGLELVDAGCDDAQLQRLDISAVDGTETFDPRTSDPTMFCGWLQATYALRLEHRRALGRGDFEQAYEYSIDFISSSDQQRDLFRVERFVPENNFYGVSSVERTVASLVDPDQDPPPNLDDHIPLYVASQNVLDDFVAERCPHMPQVVLSVPDLDAVRAGAPASPDDLPAFPPREGYLPQCAVWNALYDTRAELWAALPESPTEAAPAEQLALARRAFDRYWLSLNQSVALRAGFIRLQEPWATVSNADYELWLAATTGTSPSIDRDRFLAADDELRSVANAICSGEDGYVPFAGVPELPPLAEA